MSDPTNKLYNKIKFKINDNSSNSKINTTDFFDPSHEYNNNSPIDNFFINSREINKIKHPKEIRTIDANMMILIYVALVESYIREVSTKIINIDQIAFKCCETREVKYHSALRLEKNFLPLAILEEFSFAGRASIEDLLRNVLGIKGQLAPALISPLKEFEKVCQFRHCIIHKFGFLGPDNVITLGSKTHESLANKPLKIDFEKLQLIFETCNNIVKDLNDFLYRWFITSTVEYSTHEWTGNFELDRAKFNEYFEIFHSTDFNQEKEKASKDAYNDFLVAASIHETTS